MHWTTKLSLLFLVRVFAHGVGFVCAGWLRDHARYVERGVEHFVLAVPTIIMSKSTASLFCKTRAGMRINISIYLGMLRYLSMSVFYRHTHLFEGSTPFVEEIGGGRGREGGLSRCKCGKF